MKVWVYLDGRQQGPFELEQLLDMPVDPTTKVWFEGLPKWYPAGTLEQMKPLFDGTLLNQGYSQVDGGANAAPEHTQGDSLPSPGDSLESPENMHVDVKAEITEIRLDTASEVSPGPARTPQPCPPTYVGLAVFLTICCCSPMSVAALAGSIYTSTLYGRGNIEKARKVSEITAWLIMISIALGFIPVMLMDALF
ncbi:MAG: CD225/dispanin family protein [Muribaculaceae bacterium]|nr:CD225/dispanin family protein [Muribaculaceae bacterium]